MSKFNHIFLCSTIVFFSNTVTAENWHLAYEVTAGSKFYIDLDSIRGPNNGRSFVVKRNNLGENYYPKSERYGYLMNCDNKKNTLIFIDEYDGVDLVGVKKNNSQIKTGVEREIKEGTAYSEYFKIACEQSISNKYNSQGVAVSNDLIKKPTRNSSFRYANKLDSNEIREKLIKKTWEPSVLDSLIFNYSFVHTFNKKIESLQKRKLEGTLVGYEENRKYEYFSSFFPVIKKTMIGMNSAIIEIAQTINVEPAVISKSLGFTLREEDGYLDSRYDKNDSNVNKSIYNGMIVAGSYFDRFPDKKQSVNEWFDSRDPGILFGGYYSEFVNDFKYDVLKFFETAKKYENEQIALEQKREEERLAKEKWLNSPEGKKFLADEKKAEEIRLKAVAEEREKNAKQLAIEKAEKEKIKQNCLKITAWGIDSRELIATALKVPMSSISLIRTQLGTFDNCIAIVDTAKGPEKCRVMRIFQDKNTKEYAASFDSGIGGRAVQAVCGAWAF